MNTGKYNLIGLFFIFIATFAFSQEQPLQLIDSAKALMITKPKESYGILREITEGKDYADSIKAKATLYIGSYYNTIGVADSAIFYARKALVSLKNRSEVARAHRVMGSGYRRKGMIDMSIKTLHKSLKIAEDVGDIHLESQVTTDLGIIYANRKDYEKAAEYFEKSIEKALNPQTVIGNYVNLGTLYFFGKKYDKAEEYFLKSLDLVSPEKDPNISSTVALNLGSVYFEKADYGKAKEFYDKSKEIAERFGFKDKSLNASVHKAMVINASGNKNEAIKLLKESEPKAKEIGSLEIQRNIYDNLVTIYKEHEEFKKANEALITFYVLRDSINNIVQEKQVTELEIKYETAAKEKEILELEETQIIKDNELEKQNLIKKSLIIGFLIVLAPIIGLLIVYYQKLKLSQKYQKQKEEANVQRIENIIKNQELRFNELYTTAQNEERKRIAMELHDSVGGSLAAIKLQLENKSDEKTISDQLDSVYNQVREISHNLKPQGLSEIPFVTYLKNYFETMDEATEPSINFVPYPVEEVNKIEEDRKIEIFKIIQELLVNTLKHSKAKLIEICLNAYKDNIEILFEDNGVGFDKKKITKGLGLQNISDRVKAMDAQIDIDSVVQRGTAIRIKIPV